MAHDFVTISKEPLNNNCPECFSNEGLELTFKQKFIESSLYKSLTNDVSYNLDCKVCKTEIFPVRWTEDIERVVDYKNKAFTPKPKSFKLKRLAWLLIITLDALILLGILVGVGVIKI